MKFREFEMWCGARLVDGNLEMNTAKVCFKIIHEIQQQPFWKRERTWKKRYERQILNLVVNLIEEEMKGADAVK